jgi:small GTP-binding protein
LLERVLNDAERALLAEERRVLADARAVLGRLEAPSEDQETLARSVRQLDELFLLVVVGEFNAGKSAVVNALLGQPVLEEGVTPTTTRITVVEHGGSLERQADSEGIETIRAPVELLRETTIVDTPGTNAIVREHERLTRQFVPRSDLVLFVTSADRPFTESERAFLEAIREWGKKVVVVVNKADILESDADLEKVRGFVTEHARTLLGSAPPVHAVSARLARRSAAAGDRARSGFPALEQHVLDTLDERERLRLKLGNPLGVARRLLARQGSVVEARLELLREDVATVENIDRQLGLYGEDLRRDFALRLSDVERVLLEFERRGTHFLDATLRLGRIFDLINRSKLQRSFEQEVVADLPREVERRVEELIDWMVASELRQWRGVVEQLERRRLEHADRIVGQVTGPFEHDRARLLESTRREALRAVEGYDRAGEAQRLASSVQVAVAGTAVLEASAIGLGAAVTSLATTSLADATGLLAAGTLSVIGLFVLPARRSSAKAELRQKVERMRTRLVAAMHEEFDREAGRSLGRIREAIAPYTRFVLSERDHLGSARQELQRLQQGIEALGARVAAL